VDAVLPGDRIGGRVEGFGDVALTIGNAEKPEETVSGTA